MFAGAAVDVEGWGAVFAFIVFKGSQLCGGVRVLEGDFHRVEHGYIYHDHSIASFKVRRAPRYPGPVPSYIAYNGYAGE